jgi:GNAT superfamily N-acetyltransferase
MPSATAWRIRAARAADRDAVLALAPRLVDGFPLPGWRTREEIVRTEAATLGAALDAMPPGAALLLAESPEGDTVGLVYLELQFDYYRKAHGHVSVLAVAAEAEGKGVGRLLLEAAERWARDQGLSMLTLNVFAGNYRARGVYERLGYAPETIRYARILEQPRIWRSEQGDR